MTATFNKFQPFVEELAEKTFNLGSDTLKVMLTNSAPVNTNSQKSNLTDISAGNGYSAGGTAATISSSAQSSGTYKLVLADVTFTASGGSIGPFRYAVLYEHGGLWMDSDVVMLRPFPFVGKYFFNLQWRSGGKQEHGYHRLFPPI